MANSVYPDQTAPDLVLHCSLNMLLNCFNQTKDQTILVVISALMVKETLPFCEDRLISPWPETGKIISPIIFFILLTK